MADFDFSSPDIPSDEVYWRELNPYAGFADLGVPAYDSFATGMGVPEGMAAIANRSLLDLLTKSGKELGEGLIKGLVSPRGLVGLLGMLYGSRNTRPDVGGGAKINISPKSITRTVVPGKYGPHAQYAAQGGLMQAYAYGGPVTGTPDRPLQMEDGGFVMTKRAVDGAGGHRGLAQYIPGARPIVGPGDGSGVDDRVHARIGATTPARVSAGEAYIPKRRVQAAGGAKALYDLMNQLQRRA